MRWRLKASASWLFTQTFIQAKTKEMSKLRVTGLCEGKWPVTGEFAAQRTSNAQMFLFDHALIALILSVKQNCRANSDIFEEMGNIIGLIYRVLYINIGTCAGYMT